MAFLINNVDFGYITNFEDTVLNYFKNTVTVTVGDTATIFPTASDVILVN